MTTEANIEIIKKAYADFAKGDIPAILAALSDDVEWINPGDGIITEGNRHGRDEVGEFFALVADAWTFTAFEPRDYVASGEDVAAIGSYTAIARATGQSVSSEWVMMWKIRDGKVTYFREYSDTLALHDAQTARAAA